MFCSDTETPPSCCSGLASHASLVAAPAPERTSKMSTQLSASFVFHQVWSFPERRTTSSKPWSIALFWVDDRTIGPLELRSSVNDLASVASRTFLSCVGRKPQLFILKTRRSISEIYGRDPGRTVEIYTAAAGRYGD